MSRTIGESDPPWLPAIVAATYLAGYQVMTVYLPQIASDAEELCRFCRFYDSFLCQQK